MDSKPTIEDLKSLVFGVGRGSGIKIVARHYVGQYETQIRNLTRDVVLASKLPPDDVSSLIQDEANNLVRLLNADVSANVIADGLERYIRSRVQWNGRDTVE
jgi:hypothetical protein